MRHNKPRMLRPRQRPSWYQSRSVANGSPRPPSALNPPSPTSMGRGSPPLLVEHDPGVVRRARAVRLVAVGEHADALQLGHFGAWISAREMSAEERIEVDLFLPPH